MEWIFFSKWLGLSVFVQEKERKMNFIGDWLSDKISINNKIIQRDVFVLTLFAIFFSVMLTSRISALWYYRKDFRFVKVQLRVERFLYTD